VDVSYSWGRPDFKYTQYIHRSGTLIAEVTDDGDFLLLANRLYSNRAASGRDKEMMMMRDNNSNNPNAGGSMDRGGAHRAVAMLQGGNPYAAHGTGAEPTPISSPSVKPTGFFASAAPTPSPVVRAVSVGGGGGADLGPSTTREPTQQQPTLAADPESALNELEAFCLDGPALDSFYRELLERAARQQTAATPPSGRIRTTGGGGGGGGLNVPEASIPTLGLPPGVLTPNAAAAAREEYLGLGSVASSRLGSPVMTLRRGSAQDGMLGLRFPGHGHERRE